MVVKSWDDRNCQVWDEQLVKIEGIVLGRVSNPSRHRR